MSSAPRLDLITPEDYLRLEEAAESKHEYLGGVVYAMSGARIRHNRIATATLVALANRVRGSACEAFNSDLKIRIFLPGHQRFYYPDVTVACGTKSSEEEVFIDDPTVIVEVLSRSTRRVDQGEKKDAYLTIPSLAVYLLVEQEEAAVVAYRRRQSFEREIYSGLEAVIPLPEIGIELPLSELYPGVRFGPEPEE